MPNINPPQTQTEAQGCRKPQRPLIIPLLKQAVRLAVCLGLIVLPMVAAGYTFGGDTAVSTGLRTDGIYRFRDGDQIHYLRFFRDNFVLSVTSKANPYSVAYWHIPLSQYTASNFYTQAHSGVRFSMFTPSGIVDYSGTVTRDGLVLDSYARLPGGEFKLASQNYAFLYIDPRHVAEPNAVSHKFSYGGLEEDRGITLLNYQYGEFKSDAPSSFSRDYVASRLDAFVDIPVPQILYVKWRDRRGAVYEDSADLKPLQSLDISGLNVHFNITDEQLNVYLISQQPHAPQEEDCPVKEYKNYKCSIVYSEKLATMLDEGNQSRTYIGQPNPVPIPPSLYGSRPSRQPRHYRVLLVPVPR